MEKFTINLIVDKMSGNVKMGADELNEDVINRQLQ